MAIRPVIYTDGTDKTLPLAWGVEGGNVIAHNLTVTNANGVTNANISISNSVAAINNSSFDMSYSNISITNGTITANTDNDVNIATTANLNLISPNTQLAGTGNIYIACNDNLTLGSGNTIVDGLETNIRGSNNVVISAPNTVISSANTTITGTNISLQATTYHTGVAAFANLVLFNGDNVIYNTKNSVVYNSDLNTSIDVANIANVHTNVSYLVFNNPLLVGDAESQLHLISGSTVNGVLKADNLIVANAKTLGNVISTINNTNTDVTLPANTATAIVEIPITNTISLTNSVIANITTSTNFGTTYLSVVDTNANIYYSAHYIGSVGSSNERASLVDITTLVPNTVTTLNNDHKMVLYTISSTQQTLSSVTANIGFYETVALGSGSGTDLSNIFDVYDDTATYVENDLVYYNNHIQKCITPVTTPESFDPNKWTQTTITAELSSVIKFISSLQNLNNIQF